MEFADEMIIRHKILNAIRLLEVDQMEYMPNESIEFHYKGHKVNIQISVKHAERESQHEKVGT